MMAFHFSCNQIFISAQTDCGSDHLGYHQFLERDVSVLFFL